MTQSDILAQPSTAPPPPTCPPERGRPNQHVWRAELSRSTSALVGSASCSFSSPTRSSIFKNEVSLLASFEFIFNGSLFGFLRVIASFSLVSWCGKQAMRTRARQQASESSGDSRELPGIAVLFSGVVAPTNEEKRLKRSFQGCKP